MFVQHKHAKSAFRTSCLHLSFAYAPMVKFLAMLRLRSIIMTAVVTPGRTASSWLNEYYGNTFTLTIHIYIYIYIHTSLIYIYIYIYIYILIPNPDTGPEAF